LALVIRNSANSISNGTLHGFNDCGTQSMEIKLLASGEVKGVRFASQP